jgi:hypothetical protein
MKTPLNHVNNSNDFYIDIDEEFGKNLDSNLNYTIRCYDIFSDFENPSVAKIHRDNTLKFDSYTSVEKFLEKYIEYKCSIRGKGMYDEGYDQLEDYHLNIVVYSPDNKIMQHIWFECGSTYYEFFEHNPHLIDFWRYLK